MIKLSYDSFDRIVLNGYISSFHKASNLTFYFKFILGHLYVNKKLLFSVTENYKKIIEDFAKNKISAIHVYQERISRMLEILQNQHSMNKFVMNV